MKAQSNALKIDDLRKLPENKKCFDCHEKGTTYVVMDFGIFVCSTCSGVHREMTHKVKGVTMCNFSDKELEVLTKNGNENVRNELMAEYNPKIYPEPDKKDILKMKEFFKLKYTQKRFQRKEDSDGDSDSDDSDAEKKKKKKKEERKKAKAKAKAKKKDSSEESSEEEEVKKPKKKAEKKPEKKKKAAAKESSEEEDSEEEKKKKKKEKKKEKQDSGSSRDSSNQGKTKKLAAPPGGIKKIDQRHIEKPAEHHVNVKKVMPDHQHKQEEKIDDLLGFSAVEKEPKHTVIQDSPENWESWATFEGPAPNQHNHTQPPQQNEWGQFSQPTQQQPAQHNPNDLIKNLNQMYPQTQQPKGFKPNLGGNTGMGSLGGDDPFGELIQSQQPPQQHQNQPHGQNMQQFQGQGYNQGQYPQNMPQMQNLQNMNQQNVQQQMLMMQQNMNNLRQQMGPQGPQNQQQMAMLQQMNQMMMMMQNMMMSGNQNPNQQSSQQQQQQQQQQVKKANPQDNMFSDLFQSAANTSGGLKQNQSQPHLNSNNPFDQHGHGFHGGNPMMGGGQQQPHRASNPFDQQHNNGVQQQNPGMQRSNTHNMGGQGSNNPFDMFN